MNRDAVIGCLLGTAVGDALGLPYEGLHPRRAAAMLGPATEHRFIFRRGMVSDDTDHTCFVAAALIRSNFEPHAFTRCLARSLRWWLATCPAGVGLATARAILKLWFGFPPAKSGVFSAGNGPAMRSAIVGVVFANDITKMAEFVRRSTQITHTDPKAYQGALCIALAAAVGTQGRTISPDDLVSMVRAALADDHDEPFVALIEQACRSAEADEPVVQFAQTIGCKRGISGYVLHTVPCVIQTWLRHQHDFAGGVREIIEAGGDTDTTAAILGGIIGASVGKGGIPNEWLNGIAEWPRSIPWIQQLGNALGRATEGHTTHPPRYFVPGILPRNALFLLIVLGHGLRRLFPPYWIDDKTKS
jgi:ADP-ribosylglycohydrolase